VTGFLDAKILLIGAGKMGGALLAAWLRSGVEPESVTVIEKDAAQTEALKARGVRVVAEVHETGGVFDIIVLAVKPQSMDALLPMLAAKCIPSPLAGEGQDGGKPAAAPLRNPPPQGVRKHPLYLSIAAGKTLFYFSQHLGDAPVVRVMPNSPALIRKGISALIANVYATDAQKELATGLLDAAGETVWLEDESQMDAVTAISGSGPAYVFLFLDALIEAGKSQGLPEDIARILAFHTLKGSTKLAMKSTDSLEQLRKNVTSPGGTTEAALKVLMKDGGLKSLVDEAVKAATKRSKELA